jgi:hypothetical protein
MVNKLKNKISEIIVLSISIPFVILILGWIFAMFALPIVALIWLIKCIF